MMGPFSLLAVSVAFAALPAGCRAEIDLSRRDTMLPDCAVPCWEQAIPSLCGSWENSQCVCGGTDFDLAVTQCMSKSCPRLSTFATLRQWDIMCDKPRRDRKGDVWPFLPIHLFTMLCVAARLYSKSWIIRRFGADDWVITVTYVLYIGWFSVGHHVFQIGFGTDIWWSDPETLTWALKLFYFEAPIYLILLGLTKASILCFYLRLFPYERFCRACYALLVVVTVSTVLWAILAIVQCRPISYNWEGWKGDFPAPVKCLNLNILSWSTSAVSIALDAVILLLPMPLIVRVKSTPRRKAAIVSMFSLGIIIVIAGCLRLRFNLLYGDSVNITWDYVDLLIWTGVEVATSIAVTSLPSIRLMLHRLFPGFFGKIFAFGGHVELDREQYLEIREVQNRDLEGLDAHHGIIRRLRRGHTNNDAPPTIGGGTPRGRASAANDSARKPRKPVPTEASRVLASILGTVTGSSRRRSSVSADGSADGSITVTTDITITSDTKPAEDADTDSYTTTTTAAAGLRDSIEETVAGFGDWSSKKWDWDFGMGRNDDHG